MMEDWILREWGREIQSECFIRKQIYFQTEHIDFCLLLKTQLSLEIGKYCSTHKWIGLWVWVLL